MDHLAFELLASMLCTPRPNGSPALRETVRRVRHWLQEQNLPVSTYSFTLYPYLMESLGAWLGLCGVLLLLVAIWQWGWWGLLLAMLTPLPPIYSLRFLRPGIEVWQREQADNLLVHLPSPQPVQEIVLCAHLDSKTEWLDHLRRAWLLKAGSPAIGLALLCGALICLSSMLSFDILRWLSIICAIPIALYGLTMGVNLIGGRFSRQPSTGAVDNGAAAAVLLTLARHMPGRLRQTALTFLFTVGEEARMQGALAYVRDRNHAPPTCAINLELIGQNGPWVLWQRDGTSMLPLPTDTLLNERLTRAIVRVAGRPAHILPTINSDSLAFLQRGIPATTLGSLDAQLGMGGLHSHLDTLSRVQPDRLNEAIGILTELLHDLDDHPWKPK